MWMPGAQSRHKLKMSKPQETKNDAYACYENNTLQHQVAAHIEGNRVDQRSAHDGQSPHGTVARRSGPQETKKHAMKTKQRNYQVASHN